MGGGQGGCELRSEAFVNIQKKIIFFGGGGGSCRVGGGVRVDVYGEVKLFFGGGDLVRGGVRLGGSGWMGMEN